MRRRWFLHGSRLSRTAWLACAACLACWIGSYFFVVWFGVALPGGWMLHHQWIDGRIECVLVHQPRGIHPRNSYFSLRGRDRLSSVIAIATNNYQHPMHWLLGFAWGSVDKPTGPRGNLVTSSYLLTLPWWCITLIVVIAAVWLQRRRRTKTPLCSHCGYDLRGSAGRKTCPECGEPIPNQPRSLTPEVALSYEL